MSKEIPTIFISYSWKTKDIAETIYENLTLVGIEVLKDDHIIEYTNKISEFMDKIRDCDYALLLISDPYLKSKNCMYEILQLLKEKSVWDKILPVIIPQTSIYSVIDRIKYVDYWQKETFLLENAIKSIDPVNAIEIQKDIRIYREISASIDEFIKQVSNLKHLSPDELFRSNYSPIIDKVGFFDAQKLTDLLNVILDKNLDGREMKLENHLIKYGPSSNYYTLKGGLHKEQGKIDLARHCYIKAIELDIYNFESQNNLGRIYEVIDKNYSKAKECYEMAITSKPNMDIPRLNLGVLLSHHFQDDEGACLQYEAILKFDSLNAKAHNNLGSCYKGSKIHNYEKSQYHLLRAIELDAQYIEAYLNYGNLLKVYGGDPENGNFFYLKAKALDTDGRYKDLIDALLSGK